MQPAQTVLQSLDQLWRRLTEAPPSIQELEHRRQAQLLLSLLLILILTILVSRLTVSIPNLSNAWQDPANLLAVVAVIILAGIYGLSRAGYYKAGAIATVAVLFVLVHTAPFFVERGDFALFYAILPILLTGILLSIPMVIGVTAASLVIMVLFSLTAPAEQVDAYTVPTIYTVLICGAIVIFMRHRNLIEKDRQAALRESESKYRLLLEQAADGILISDLQGNYLMANPKGCEMLGYSEDELLRLSARDLIPPEDLDAIPLLFDKLAAGKLVMVERRLRRKDGSLLPVEISAKMLEDGRVQAIMRDITERRRAEEALRQSETRFAKLFQANPAAIVLSEYVTGRILNANESYLRLVGYEHKEIIGRTSLELGTWTTPDERTRFVEGLHKNGSVRDWEITVRRKSGEVRCAFVSAELVDLDGEQHILGMLYDITERKQAEETLRESTQRLQLAVSAAKVGLWDWDMRTNQTHYSPEWKRQIGYAEDEISNDAYEWRSRTHPEDLDRVLKTIEAYIENPQSEYNTEFRFRHKDGSYRWILAQASLHYDEHGKPVRMLGSHLDITERKQAEEALRESSQRLQLAISAANVGLWDWDMSSNQLHYSPEWKRQIGYAEDEISNDFHEWQSRVHPDDLDRVLETIHAYLEKPWPEYNNEFRFRHKDGSYRWILAQASLYYDENGKPKQMIGSHIDITERKQVEQGIKQWKERYESAILATGYILYDWDAIINEVTYSGNLKQILGYSPEELRGDLAHWLEIIHPDDVSRFQAEVEYALVAKNDLLHHEYRVRRKDGSYIMVHGDGANILNAEGQVTRAVGFVVDITERKQAEEALQKSQIRLELLNNISAKIISGVSTEEIIEHTIKQVSGYFKGVRVAYATVDEQGNAATLYSVEPPNMPGLAGTTANLTTAPEYFALLRRYQKIVVTDVKEDARLTGLAELIAAGGTLAFVDVPMRYSDTLVGLICFDAPEPRQWSDHELTTLTEIAEYLSIALKNVEAQQKHQHAEEALRQSEERYRIITDLISDYAYAYQIEPDGSLVTEWGTRDSFTRLTGYSFEEIGVTANLFHPEEQERIAGDMQAMMAGESTSGEYRIIIKSGEVRWLNVHRRPVWDAQQKRVVRYFGVGQDITERKQAEEALRKSEARYRALIESQIDLISRYLPDSTLTFVNDAYCQFYGKTPQELIGHSYLSMVAPEFREGTLKNIENMVRAPVPIISEAVNYRWDGEECWIQWVIQGVTDENGQVVELQAIGRDITRLKQSEQILRQSEEAYRDLYENAPNGYLSVNREGLIGRCNRYLVEMLGYNNADEIIGTPIEELYADSPNGKSKVLQIFRDMQAGGTVRDEELQMQKRDNTLVWVNLTTNAESDDEGQLWTRAMVVNITERKRATEELRQSEERFAKAFRASPFGLVITRLSDGKIIEINHSWQNIFGYNSEDLVGQTSIALNVFKNPDDRQRAVAQMQEQGFVRDLELEINRKSGETRLISVAAEMIEINNELCAITILNDITERKQAEQTLQLQSERLKLLNEIDRAILAAASAKDIAEVVLKKIRQLIPSHRASIILFDYEAQETLAFAVNFDGDTKLPAGKIHPLDQEIVNLFPPDKVGVIPDIRKLTDPPPVIAQLRSEGIVSLLGAPLLMQGELQGRLNLSSHMAHAFTSEHLEIAGQVATQLGIALQQNQLYEQTRLLAVELEQRVAERTAQLEAANKELEAFSYSVSHDLRAPLRAIDGFSEVLLEDYLENLDKTGQDYLQRVRAATQRMGRLIDDLLGLSRLTRSEMKRERVNLSALAESIVQELRRSQPDRAGEVIIAPEMYVEADMQLLQIALTNLIGNAWKFTQNQAHTKIEFGVIHEKGLPIYFVRDNGVGFDMLYADRLFGPFQRLHTRHEFEGTGIGLATVQRILQRHGGRIWAEAEVGKGAVFYFIFTQGIP